MLIGAGLVGGLIVVGAMKLTNRNVNVSPKNSLTKYVNNEAPATAGAIDLTQAAQIASPSVVFIEAAESASSNSRSRQNQDDPFGFFFGFQMPPKKGTGSGVIISQDGYIITNNHVVDFADEVKVNLTDGRKYVAKVVGKDPRTDLAVLKINQTGLPAIQKGNSDNLRIGEWVLAIGYPYDIGTTVTAGIVSAKDKKLRDDSPSVIEDFIQTDAVVNPGNSGGALVDAYGRLVGINSAIQTRTGSYEGYSFAIPINLATKVVDDIIKTGSVQRSTISTLPGARPRLGIEMVNDRYFKQAIQENNINVEEGVLIADVEDGSPAQMAGIVPNDVIVKIEGKAVKNTQDVRETISKAKVGDVVKVTVFRNGRTKEIPVTLKAI